MGSPLRLGTGPSQSWTEINDTNHLRRSIRPAGFQELETRHSCQQLQAGVKDRRVNAVSE
ncbi:hypothetical protein DTL42_07325 [Bremerella cremea]|uniref:Uncharacterized protein n=1 Tax=Bremerella cremea TaxID=1031537 RepID=A0A368KUS7_9BACT|nr:hypothetical protein DTL42_07325 [Bremerella cremea]